MNNLLDLPVSVSEISKALKEMSNDKSPCLDGFTTHFYKFFWLDINYALKQGKLIDSQ